MPSPMPDWLRLPSRIAMLLGLGALSITGAKGATETYRNSLPIPEQGTQAVDNLLIWADNGRIYISETGKPAEELRLGITAEAETLRRLLVREGATAATPYVLPDRIILAGAGGSGLHWESQRAGDQDKPDDPALGIPDKPASGATQAGDRIGSAQSPRGADGRNK